MQFSKALACAILSLASAAPINELARRSDPITDGFHGAFNNAAQVQDTLNNQLKSHGGHATADTLGAFITGADSQIDNLAATLGRALDPITLGASGELADVALGPFAQSVTNGAEVLASNIVGMPIDAIAGGVGRLGSFVQNLGKVSAAAKANKLDTTKLDEATAQLKKKLDEAKKNGKGKRSNPSTDGFHGAFNNAAQVQDTLNNQLKSHGGHATADTIGAFITGADSQIDNLAATLGRTLDPITLGASGELADVALGPFAQSVTNGAEVLASNIVGMPIDAIAGGVGRLGSFVQNLGKVSAAAKANKLDTTRLDQATAQLKGKLDEAKKNGKGKRSNPITDGFHGAFNNAAQVQDTLNNQLKSHGGHATADTIGAFITGADSQIDNLAATLGRTLDPITLGASGELADVALGPFAQSVTNGAEVLASNIVGMPIDAITGGIGRLGSFVQNLGKVSAAAKANKLDTTKLDQATAQLKGKLDEAKKNGKGKRSNPIADGFHGAFNNAAQVQDTLNNQLKSHGGHATADTLGAFITGADSQIDNLAATLGRALDPITLGASGELADVALGPFAQSVTNGAEVLASNIVGMPIDAIAGGVGRLGSFVQNLGKVSAAAKANKLDTTKLDAATAQLKKKLDEANHHKK